MERRRLEISLGLIVLFSLGVLAYIAVKMGNLKGLGTVIRAQVVLVDAGGLVEGAAVRVAGVQVGRVTYLQVDFDKARAGMVIDEAAEIRQDAEVAIRSRSLLGEKYIELIPHSKEAPLITPNFELKAAPATLDVDELVGKLGPLVSDVDVKSLGPLLDQLHGTVKDNRENLTQTITSIASLVERLEKVKFDDPQAQADVKAILKNLRVSTSKLPGLLDSTHDTMTSLNDKAGPLIDRIDTTVKQLEPTLVRLPDTLDRLNHTLEGADKLMTSLEPVLEGVKHIDYTLAKKLLRDEGLLVRFRREEVEWPASKLADRAGLILEDEESVSSLAATPTPPLSLMPDGPFSP